MIIESTCPIQQLVDVQSTTTCTVFITSSAYGSRITTDRSREVCLVRVEHVISNIQRKFENMRYLSEAGRTIRKGIDSLFMNLLDETRFFVLDQESSYDENVDRMARALTNQGELDAGFAQRVREREKYSTMVLDQNIAFPHTKNMLSKLTLAMGVFPDMLKDDKYGNIRIIILLGIPESMEDDTVLVRLYDDILSIGKKPDVIPKIQKMESYREFLLYIAEENNIFE